MSIAVVGAVAGRPPGRWPALRTEPKASGRPVQDRGRREHLRQVVADPQHGRLERRAEVVHQDGSPTPTGDPGAQAAPTAASTSSTAAKPAASAAATRARRGRLR